MKSPKSYLFLLLFLIPVWNLAAATQHVNRSHIQLHHHALVQSEDDSQFASDFTDDDDVLIADDDDGDDISEALIKSVPATFISFDLFASCGADVVRADHSVTIGAQKTSLSYLRVFRI